MKSIFHIFLLFVVATLFSQAVTRGDVKVIEASESIRYLSQKLVKEYLFFYNYPEKTELKSNLNEILLKLNDDFRIIATTTKDSDTKDVLEFLAYSKDQIEELFMEKPNSEKVALMLDYSETLLEGANSIESAHIYEFSQEEEMLMITKKMEYLLERITKYYMALNVGFNTPTNQESMQEAISKFEENAKKINTYAYPQKERKMKAYMNSSWEFNKVFLSKSDKIFIPTLIFSSTRNLENTIANIALYHSKNQ